MRWFVLAILLFSLTLSAQSLQTLDPDFFPGETSYAEQGLQTLNPDFFKSPKGLLPFTEAGSFGCLAITASTIQAASAKVGSAVDKFCEGKPALQWVPPSVQVYPGGVAAPLNGYRPYDYRSNSTRSGHFQICCIRKESQGIRPSRSRRSRPRTE